MTRAHALELVALTLLAIAASAAIPWHTGYLGWSWDALNHHVYLGMTAEHPRWDLDVMPANYQTYQYPYLYWPVYRLSLLNVSGAFAGVVWSSLQAALLLPPIWFIARGLLPDIGSPVQGVAERTAGCVLAWMSIVLWSSLETTANDLLAAVPLLWSVALGTAASPSRPRLLAVGALQGVSMAFKLSNALFLPMLLVWWWQPQAPHFTLKRGLLLAAGSVGGFGLAYAPWGLQLWRQTGNAFYPYLGG